jgi:hypothetical protein
LVEGEEESIKAEEEFAEEEIGRMEGRRVRLKMGKIEC